MPATFTPIATQTLASPANAFDFTSISSSYTHLYVLCNFISNAPGAGVDYYLELNGGGGGSYYSVMQTFTTSARNSTRRDNAAIAQLFYLQLGSTSGGVTAGQIWLPYYKDTSSKRNFQVRGGQANRETGSMSGFWNNTATINRIKILSDPSPSNAYFASGSSCTIFGLLEA